MVNSTENSKLYEVVKQTLSNYEAPYNDADWAQMQSILDLTPKSKSFKFKHVLLSIFESLKGISKSKTLKWTFYLLLGLALLGGGAYLLYTNLSSVKTPDKISPAPQQKIENKTNTPITPPNTNVQGVPKTDDKIQQPLNTADSVLSTSKKDIVKSDESTITQKEKNLIEKNEKKKTEKADTSANNNSGKQQQVLNKGNESAVMDKSDSTKMNKKRSSTINSDSLTRYLNQLPTDSLKIPK